MPPTCSNADVSWRVGRRRLMPGVTLGDFRITLVRDSAYYWDGGAMFGVVSKTAVEPPDPGGRAEPDPAGLQLLRHRDRRPHHPDRHGRRDKPDDKARSA